jgi:hypothetical protein
MENHRSGNTKTCCGVGHRAGVRVEGIVKRIEEILSEVAEPPDPSTLKVALTQDFCYLSQ